MLLAGPGEVFRVNLLDPLKVFWETAVDGQKRPEPQDIHGQARLEQG